MHPFSASSSYAVRALALMPGPDGDFKSLDELADASQAPGPYLGKVLQSLQRAGLVESLRGRKGGFRLKRPGQSIRLIEVLDAMDGSLWRSTCILGFEQCAGNRSCPAKSCCLDMREKMIHEMNRLTILDIRDVHFLRILNPVS